MTVWTFADNHPFVALAMFAVGTITAGMFAEECVKCAFELARVVVKARADAREAADRESRRPPDDDEPWKH